MHEDLWTFVVLMAFGEFEAAGVIVLLQVGGPLEAV